MPFAVPFHALLLAVLRGHGQIMLQNHAGTGMLFLAGIAWGGLDMALGALLATLAATLLAYRLGWDAERIGQGLYGFSAALTGVALVLFFQPGVLLWLAIPLAGCVAALIQHQGLQRGWPLYTLPFILVTWLCLWLGSGWLQPAGDGSVAVQMAGFALSGYGQVIFQDSALSGLLFFAGVLLASPLAALYALAASMLAGLLMLQLGADAQAVASGLLGYNAVLCAMVFAGARRRDALWVGVSVLAALLTGQILVHFGLPALTFPFVAGSWLALGLRRVLAG